MMTKNQRRIENPIRFFYPTSDDWSPNFPRNTVEVAVYAYHDSIDGINGMIRIVVRGADDTLMEKDAYLRISEYEAKLKKIQYWCDYVLPNPLTKNWLKSQGFKFQ